MTRISTATLNNTVLNAALTMESTYAAATIQESTGLVSPDFKGLGASSQRLLNLEGQLQQASAYQKVTTTAASYVEGMFQAVGNMISSITTLRTQISATSTTQDFTSANATGASLMNQIGTDINSQQAGRYLFAGSKIDTMPVDLSTYSSLTLNATTADTSYYQGDTQVQSVTVSAQQTVTYGVTGDNPAFEEALRACQMISKATNTGTLTSGLDLANKALKDLSNLQEQISASANSIQQMQIMQGNVVSITESSISDVKNVDTAAVALTVSQFSAQLQASYKAASETLKLNLASYL